MMRRTGKLYSLTLVSVSLGIVASVSVSLWNFNTSEFHLWLDLIPHGFGIASMITTTLIVSFRTPRVMSRILFRHSLAITGHDCKRSQGGHSRRYGHHLSFPDDRPSTWGQLERSASSGCPHETASEADHRTGGFRGVIHFRSLRPVQLTPESYHRRSLNGFATAPQSSRNYQLPFGWRLLHRTQTL
jgi:hypothetical protein